MIRLKNEIQIEGIRKSCRLLAEMYKSIIPQIVAGMSTKDLGSCRLRHVASGHKEGLRR